MSSSICCCVGGMGQWRFQFHAGWLAGWLIGWLVNQLHIKMTNCTNIKHNKMVMDPSWIQFPHGFFFFFFVHICQCTVVVFHPALNHLHHNPTEPWAVSRPGWRSWPRPCSGLRMWMCWWWTGCMAPPLPTTWWWRITRRWLCRSLSSSTSCRWDKVRVIFWNSSMLLLLLLKEEHSWSHLRSISLSIKHFYSSACNRLRAVKDARRWFQLRINVSNRNMDANWSPSTSSGSVWGHMSLVSLGLYLEGRLEESQVRCECIFFSFFFGNWYFLIR